MTAEPAPIRTAAELEARVARMNPDKTQKLEDQVKALADRLALLMAVCADCEIDVDLERDTDERNEWRELRRVILGNDEASIAERSRRRKLVFYTDAVADIRRWLSRSLKAKEKQAA